MDDRTSDIEKASYKGGDSAGVVKELHIKRESLHLAEPAPGRGGVLEKLRNAIDRLDGVESRGIERVLPHERDHTHRLSDCMWMWLAANTSPSTFALGTLGASVFGLGFRPAVLTIIFFNLVFTIPVAYFSTFGPKLGLRQMTLSRFSFSLYFPNSFFVILNIVSCVGWSTIKCITGALALRAVSAGNQPRIPSAVAIIIIAVLTLVPSFVGYRYVFAYERYSWIPMAIVFFIVLGLSAEHFVIGPWEDTPSNMTAAGVLSFGSAVCGFGLGWSPLAADYTVNFPEDSSSFKIFAWTYIGLNVPLILLEVLGAAMMTAINSSAPRFAERYAKDSVGGLLGAALEPAGGFGQFCLVILAFGLVANNILNMYSLALTTQALHPWLQAIPRPFICVIGSVVSVVLSVVGINHFDNWLDTMLVLLSYLLAIYSTIIIEEHLIFRRGNWLNYDPDDHGDLDFLPVGFAAFFATGAGVVGFVLGMSQPWYIGILAKKIEPTLGGDIGFELAAAFCGIVYPIARYIEKRRVGR